MQIVELTAINVHMAAMVGVWRNLKSLKHEEGYNGADNRRYGWQYNIDGCMGEIAVAKHFDVFWDGTVNTFRRYPDVGIYEVRASGNPNAEMTLRPRDKDDETIYIFATCDDLPIVKLRGWFRGCEGKVDQYYGFGRTGNKNRPKAWFIPQADLHSMESIPRIKG